MKKISDFLILHYETLVSGAIGGLLSAVICLLIKSAV